MNKSQLIEIISSETNLKKRDVEAISDVLFTTIMNEVAKGEKIQVTGFGSFEARNRSERTIKNPRSGEITTVPAMKIASFSAGSVFKAKVSKK
jgi:DNA-binding protein HU-beta